MCGRITRLSSVVCLHNLGKKSYAGKLFIWQNKDQKLPGPLILDLCYFKSQQLFKEKYSIFFFKFFIFLKTNVKRKKGLILNRVW